MFDTDAAVLDADAILCDVVAARRVAEQADVRVLRDAARWADLHGCLDDAGAGAALTGTEQLVCFGGDGTPGGGEVLPGRVRGRVGDVGELGGHLGR